jgi:hypothetical protein
VGFWGGQRGLEEFAELIGDCMKMWGFADFGRDQRGVGGYVKIFFGFVRCNDVVLL